MTFTGKVAELNLTKEMDKACVVFNNKVCNLYSTTLAKLASSSMSAFVTLQILFLFLVLLLNVMLLSCYLLNSMVAYVLLLIFHMLVLLSVCGIC